MGRGEAVRLFVLQAPLNMTLADLDGRIIAASPPLVALAGLQLEDFVGRTLLEIYGDAAEGYIEMCDALAAGAEQHTVVREVRLPSGDRGWARSQGSYWRDDNGSVLGVLMVNQDVTGEIEAEHKRRDIETLLKAVVDNIPATLTVYDLETLAPALMNARAQTLLNIGGEKDLNAPIGSWMGDRRLSKLPEYIRSAEQAGGMIASEEEVTAGPLTGRTLYFRRMVFSDGAGRRRLLSIGEDVTDLKDANKAMEAAVDEARRANAAKSEFLAHISHEIRTPLNGVLGMAQAMAREPLPEEQAERLEVIRQSGETLLTLLNDVLDLSKIEAGKLDLEAVDLDLGEVMRGACRPFQLLAEQKGVAFRLRLRDAGGHCRGDPTRLRQVISNLASNALKFTERGAIEVAAERTGQRVRFSVSDSGVGMTPEALARLFQPFSQGDASITRRFGGTGLGLAISRELVELMGGAISVDSELGRGSTFAFDLDLPAMARTAQVSRPGRNARRPGALRVLAAEDNRINQLVLRTLLAQTGLQVTEVENGAQAVEAWEREPWDAILMDVQMPVMDGPAATEIIRRREQETGRERTPIIALTANAMTHQAAEYLSRGMDALVAKPIQVEQLLATLFQFLDEPPTAQEPGRAKRA